MRLNLYNPWLSISLNKEMLNKILLTLIVILFIAPFNLYSMVNDDKILSDIPPQYLSQYGFFLNQKQQIPTPGVLPYNLITSLFSDYADKHRFVYVPKGQFATHKADSVFDFPIGSTLIKTFSYATALEPPLNRHLIETRLLIRKTLGWETYTYVWDNAGEEAELKVAGKTVPATYINSEGRKTNIRYRVPNKNQCKECHLKDETIVPIGPKPRNLNTNYNYDDGTMNQLMKWSELGYIQSYPENNTPVVDYLDATQSIDKRARAYLAINCGHCHSPSGSASNSGLYLNYKENRNKQLGVYKSPVATGRGSGDLDYSIVPGHPDDSILLYRMMSNAPDIMMPESGRSIMHQEGVELVYQWIKEMQ